MRNIISRCLKLFFCLFFLGLLFYSILPKNVFALEWQKYPKNPIFSGDSLNWDKRDTSAPTIIKNSSGYQMWYNGNGGSGWLIGSAFSTDGITNWSRTTSPAIAPNPNDPWEKETVHGYVLYEPLSLINKYQMWYSVFGTEWISGPDRYRVQYATSENGLDWIKSSSWVLKGTPNSWDSGGISRGLSVVHTNDGIYHMWYSGTNNENLGINPFWRIGYATSTDGINWSKENSGNPVITPTKEWELINVSSPNVIFENGIFHMWYTASVGDEAKQIVYAYSLDGINWIKPEEHNPVITEGNNWDNYYVSYPFVIREGNILKMWYSATSLDTIWHIGYATASADWLPTLVPTLTPTPSPTTTLTPTPEPTPTIPTIPTTKVIVIPGTTASWNLSDLIQCKTDSNSTWSLLDPAKPVYDPVIRSLKEANWETLLFPYDWRKHVSENALLLKSFIDAHVQPGEKVNIVAHSMGGLVARSYIEQDGVNNKVDKVMTVGTPHRGSITAYPTWSAGEIQSDDVRWKFMVMLIEKQCAIHTLNAREVIQKYFPSVQDTLPIFDYLIDNKTGKIKPVQTMAAKNTWLLSSSFPEPFFGATVGTLSGTDQKTGQAYRVGPRNALEQQLGDWEDGAPVKMLTTKDGDNTVLSISSTLPDAENITIPGSHTDIISSERGIGKIMDFLNTSPQPLQMAALRATETKNKPTDHKWPKKHIAPAATPESGLFIVGYPAKLWVIDPHGKIYKDTDGLVSLMDPRSGVYKLMYWPKEKETHIIVAQILKNDKNLWKEYTFNTRFPQFHIPQIHFIKFNAEHPREDILD